MDCQTCPIPNERDDLRLELERARELNRTYRLMLAQEGLQDLVSIMAWSAERGIKPMTAYKWRERYRDFPKKTEHGFFRRSDLDEWLRKSQDRVYKPGRPAGSKNKPKAKKGK
jgi:hypothetical protein